MEREREGATRERRGDGWEERSAIYSSLVSKDRWGMRGGWKLSSGGISGNSSSRCSSSRSGNTER